VIDELKHTLEEFPGPADVVLMLDTPAGVRQLRLGEAYRVQNTPTLLAELEQVLGPVRADASMAAGAPAPAAATA
jgi:hypothetical protein